MKFKIIFAFATLVIVSLIFIMAQRHKINEAEGALENTIEQLENSDAKYSDKDELLPNKQPE